jgi:PhzF family phenazine biosynthesis protein
MVAVRASAPRRRRTRYQEAPGGRVCDTSAVLRPFTQVDVFSEVPGLGNPVAVVLDGADLTTEQMQRFAHWTNLSETTFVLPATRPDADYRVRIFTPTAELPFAGHPTLGTCHAWTTHLAKAHPAGTTVQEGAAGLVTIRRTSYGSAFGAPPLLRQGPVDEDAVRQAASQLQIDRSEIVGANWVDNGPGWMGLLLADAERVLALRPGAVDRFVGVIGPYPAGSDCAFEVRAFFPSHGATGEDPVTGSLNASLAQWLIAAGRAQAPYLVSQGSLVGAAGRVHIEVDQAGAVWVGGTTTGIVFGQVDL